LLLISAFAIVQNMLRFNALLLMMIM